MLKATRQRRAADADRERLRFEAAFAEHRERVDRAVQARNQARAQRRWWGWLQGFLVVRRERRLVPVAPVAPRPSSDQEGILTAGVEGERLAMISLGRELGDEWTLLRGYRNGRGEVDHLLLGPRGIFAIEGKHRNATVYCAGDHWWYIKYDKYGNAVERDEMTDRRGRSPSQQVNEPADELESFLRSRGHLVPIRRIVLLTHSRSRLGTCTSPTVHVTTSTAQVIKLMNASQTVLAEHERAQVERLIVRDHGYHEARRASAHSRGRDNE
jgi:hypothetical protein